MDPISNTSAYKDAGVDIDKGNVFVQNIKQDVESTYNKHVIGKHGNFGGQYQFYDHTLVVSTDGVGTKGILVKQHTGDYYNCGHDIVNHCINDILVQGGTPLFFLDYIASSSVQIQNSTSFVKGCCDACKKVGCVLLGGETAEMPSVYQDGHMDMVGTIVGEKTIHIDLQGVRDGDIAIGFASSGPQTNGYTLIRKIIEDASLMSPSQSPSTELMDIFTTPHGSFLEHVHCLQRFCIITGMCHITGGGLTENLKRIIPSELHLPSVETVVLPDWCKWLQQHGNISIDEMKKVFNCGIGFIVFIRPCDMQTIDHIMKSIPASLQPIPLGTLCPISS